MARRRSSTRRAGAGRRIPAGVALAVVLVIGAVVLIGPRAGRTPATEAVMTTGDEGAATAGRVATGPARAGEGFFDRLFGGWNSAARIEELEAQNRELQAWRDLAERLAERNRRYEALLRMPADTFGEGADIENSIAAQLVLDSGGPFMRTLVANAGELHGVKVGYIAVNENGLVGRVVSVGQHSSRVLMLDDYNSRIPVMGESSRVRAVLAGQAARRPELSLYPYQLQAPRMDFIVGAQSPCARASASSPLATEVSIRAAFPSASRAAKTMARGAFRSPPRSSRSISCALSRSCRSMRRKQPPIQTRRRRSARPRLSP
ncbi:MAG: rod shape-determining protein MreC [Caulobacteraceae bacterium]|nr:rod shape-determining protein MreC [Caulobacteraceae bacterium]